MTLTAFPLEETLPMTAHPRTNPGNGCACGKPTGDHAYLCRDCVHQLADDLRLLGPAATEVPANARWERDYDAFGAQVRDDQGKLVPVAYGRATSTRWDTPVGSKAGLVEHLELTASRQVRIGTAGGSEKPVPFNPRAAEIRGRLDQQLRPWALWLAGEYQGATLVAMLTHAPLSGVVTYLALNLEEIRHSPDAGQLADAVHTAVRTIQKVIDRPGNQRYGGPCGNELPSGILCDTKLYADEGDRDFVCPTCGAEWAVEERQAWLADLAAEELATAPVIAAAFAREPDDQDDAEPKEFRRLLKRIHQWASRDRLTARGELRGQPLYRVGDVGELMKAYEERGDRRGGRREKKASAR